MVEKKQIVYDLLLRYNGPFSVEDFYAEVEQWMREKGLTRDLKRKSEQILKKGKRIEWVIEAWKSLTTEHKHLVKLRVLMDDIKEVRKKKEGKSAKLHSGKVLVEIDGWLETSLTARWTQKPLYTLFRTFYDKYIWMIAEKYEGPLQTDCYDLHKRLKSFFEVSKNRFNN